MPLSWKASMQLFLTERRVTVISPRIRNCYLKRKESIGIKFAREGPAS